MSLHCAKGRWLGLWVLLAALLCQRGEAAPAPPALYTAAQARAGAASFAQHCAACHGAHLHGQAGPALTGPTFASAAAGYTVRDIFEFLSVNMPAYAPGSLSRTEYVAIMAFLLQQNGYPAGRAALTQRIASTSTVPLRYHGTPGAAGGSERLVKRCAAPAGARASAPPRRSVGARPPAR